MLEDQSLRLLTEALAQLDSAFSNLPALNDPAAQSPASSSGAMRAVLAATATRLEDNYPYFHPLYAGQMLKPPHPIARAAYALATWINPNNHALDGGRASSRMEIEAVREIAAMFGWPQHLGHLTSGGTFANLEALWIAGHLAPGKKVLASTQSHYTHHRISAVLGLTYTSIPTDNRGCMDLSALEHELQSGDVGTVVVTMGTTAIGTVDPLPAILALRERYSFRIHADAAYGGYFTLAANLDPEVRAAYDALAHADSIVIDPHKHGLQPYGCGCILFRDPSVGRFYKHDSPYTYFSSDELHLGEISLECSRAGASAVALWATQRLLPLVREGEFAHGLQRSRAAALELHRRLLAHPAFLPPFPPQLDIVVWAVRAPSIAESSRLARDIFEAAAARNLHLALADLPVTLFPAASWPSPVVPSAQSGYVSCLRSVLMKPEHYDWLNEIWSRLTAATEACL